MILPISIQKGLSERLSYKVFNNLEFYLKKSEWCQYQSNSDVINIINSYKKDLSSHLKNQKVIQIVAERLRVGSLIRINLEKSMSGVNVGLDIVGENGKDLYVSKKTYIDDESEDLIFDQLRSWINDYGINLPYKALIKGMVGKEFTADMGSLFGMSMGQQIEIRRPIKKKIKVDEVEITRWDSEFLADGEIFNTSTYQSIGMVSKKRSHKYIKLGYWIKEKEAVNPKEAYKASKRIQSQSNQSKGFSFGKIGEISLALTTGMGKNSTAINSDEKIISGMLYGVNANIELWVTRRYWASIEYEKTTSTYDKESGSLTNDSVSVGLGHIKIKGGYRYLPLGHFYGPRLDTYLGYANYSYSHTFIANDGLTSNSFGGFLFGVKVDLPIYRFWRFNASTDLIITSNYTEEKKLFGNAESVYSYNFRLGVDYNYSRVWTGLFHFDFNTNEAKFTGVAEKNKFREQKFNFGVRMTI